MDAIIEGIVRVDVVAAVVVLIVFPLGFLLTSLGSRPVGQRLLVYWRASSLLAITVYLLSAEWTLGYVTGPLALFFIPAALWWGDALYDPGQDPLPKRTQLATVYRYWRAVAALLCAVSLPFILPAVPCAFGGASTLFCELWITLPQEYFAFVHGSADPAPFGQAALGGLGLYAVYAVASAGRLYRQRVRA